MSSRLQMFALRTNMLSKNKPPLEDVVRRRVPAFGRWNRVGFFQHHLAPANCLHKHTWIWPPHTQCTLNQENQIRIREDMQLGPKLSQYKS